jgi:SRSO17 transposase
MLAGAKWKTVSWRVGTKGRLKARFAALRVRTADGPPQRIWGKGQQHLPGDEAWLVGNVNQGEEVLPRQSPCYDGSAHTGRHHQGTMDL